MSPLTDVSSTTAKLDSLKLSDEVLDPNGQDLTASDAPDHQVDRPSYYERQLGESEASYYLPSRAAGVNDMYLHLGFKAPMRLVLLPRVRAVWTILRMRHPLMASHIVMRKYDDIKFVFHVPKSPEDALAEAESQLDYRHQDKDALIDSYLNGPRTLSKERLTYLVISHTPTLDAQLPTPPSTPSPDESADLADDDRVFNHEYLLCATHFVCDGMALHQFSNDFFNLLGSSRSQEELDQLVVDEWKQRWAQAVPPDTPALPVSVEKIWGTEEHRFRRAAEIIDFQNNLDRQIGGQSFPRKKNPIRRTVVPTTSFSEDLTKGMLKKCKAQGVSISSTMFAVCNIAWVRTNQGKRELPMLMYAPINIRPYLPKPATESSYWFLSLGYFNVIFPSFIPSSCDVSKTFWLRARSAKAQSSRVATSRMIIPRSREMAIKRGKQARVWAKEDDEKEAGVWVPPPKTSDTAPPPRAPSTALTGLSLLGNLDGMYKHAKFPDIKLHTLTTGSRQRNGAMLMFAYTFVGKLWVSIGYDENGFELETVDLFWKNVHDAIREFLL